MNWQDIEYRAALLRLWKTGVLKKTRRVLPLAEHLLSLGWVTQSSRREELHLNESGSAQLPTLLDNVWPPWRMTLGRLGEIGLPLTAAGLQDLARSAREVPPLPRRLHNKTFAALTRAHSKSHSGSAPLPPGLFLTTDGVLRIRPNRGLTLHAGRHRLDCDDLTEALGEVILPERALLDGIRAEGVLPAAVMTVENLGPFVDMPKPEDLLLIHQPGWNTGLSLQFMDVLGEGPPLCHFGDLDPEGLAIYLHLCRQKKDYRHFLPSFWDEYVEPFSQELEGGWPEAIADSFSEPLLQRLFAAGAWLEQEPVVLDPRFEGELVGHASS